MIKKHILIMAGGTGGHIFPALSIAKELVTRGTKVSWLGSKFGMEKDILPKYKYNLYVVSSVGLRGKKIIKLLQAPFLLLLALVQTIVIFIKIKPEAVLGMGGFSSGVGGLVAKLFNIPLIIHEQNAIAGTTNKILAKMARCTYQAFDNSFSANVEAITVGNPIVFYPKAKKLVSKPLNLLVIGGSLGAKAINSIIPKLQTKLSITHQSGLADYDRTITNYKCSTNYKNTLVVGFIDDMADAYSLADIVICRAGAMTVSELMQTGSASILIPFPYAIDDHQTLNAKILSEQGGAILLPQVNLSVNGLDAILATLTSDKIRDMGQKAKLLVKKDSAKIIADNLLS